MPIPIIQISELAPLPEEKLRDKMLLANCLMIAALFGVPVLSVCPTEADAQRLMEIAKAEMGDILPFLGGEL